MLTAFTAPAQLIMAPDQLITALAQFITAPASPPVKKFAVYTALFSKETKYFFFIFEFWMQSASGSHLVLIIAVHRVLLWLEKHAKCGQNNRLINTKSRQQGKLFKLIIVNG